MFVNRGLIDHLRGLHHSLPIFLALCVQVGDQVEVQIAVTSVSALAQLTGRSETTVRRALRELVHANRIRKLDHRRGKHVYELLPINGEPVCLSKRASKNREAASKSRPIDPRLSITCSVSTG